MSSRESAPSAHKPRGRFCVPSVGIDNSQAGRKMSEMGGMMAVQAGMQRVCFRSNIRKTPTNLLDKEGFLLRREKRNSNLDVEGSSKGSAHTI